MKCCPSGNPECSGRAFRRAARCSVVVPSPNSVEHHLAVQLLAAATSACPRMVFGYTQRTPAALLGWARVFHAICRADRLPPPIFCANYWSIVVPFAHVAPAFFFLSAHMNAAATQCRLRSSRWRLSRSRVQALKYGLSRTVRDTSSERRCSGSARPLRPQYPGAPAGSQTADEPGAAPLSTAPRRRPAPSLENAWPAWHLHREAPYP